MYYYNPYKHELTDERLELISEKEINGTMFLYFKLHPKDIIECPSCQQNNITKYGYYTRKIKANIFIHKNANISVKCSKYRCKDCITFFNDTFQDVDKKSTIAKSTIINILMMLKQDICFKDIASLNNVDSKTVINIMENNVVADRKPFSDVLCLDEFKNLKSSIGKYAFLIYDPIREICVDVLPDRRLDHLQNYFLHIEYSERNKVKYIITDMNESYRTIIQSMFPNATHVVDSFHYIRYITTAMLNLRIRTQSKYKTTDAKYSILKKYWKLLQIDIKKVEEGEVYNHIQCKKTSKSDVINDMLSLSAELKEGYEILQDFYLNWNNAKYEKVDEFMNNWINLLNNTQIPEFNSLEKTFTNWRQEISNSFIRFGDKRLSNGPIEGMNNRIKALKRGAFGFTNFYHFRQRIFILINKELVLRNPDNPLLILRKKRDKNKDEK